VPPHYVTFAALSVSLLVRPALAQAPASADLWRLAAATLAAPAVLETGPVAAFWNPAAGWDKVRLRAGAEILQTPDILGVGAYVVGASYRLSGFTAQALVGRTTVGDLVRTTTSPASEPGGIPVYEQLAGLGAAVGRGPWSAGVLLRAHESRFDAERSNGLTLDAGVRAAWSRLTVAGATHFFPLDVSDRDVTDFYGGAGYRFLRFQFMGSPGELMLQYGVSVRRRRAGERSGAAGGMLADHVASAGVSLERHVRFDVAMARETGYLDSAWRPSLGVELRLGRYEIAVSRASGLSGIGASYRVGLDVDLMR